MITSVELIVIENTTKNSSSRLNGVLNKITTAEQNNTHTLCVISLIIHKKKHTVSQH